MNNYALQGIAQSWLYNLPVILVCAMCLLGVLVYARRARTASILAFLGFGALLALAVLSPIIHSVIFSQGGSWRAAASFAYSIVERVVQAGAYVCFMIAIYVERPVDPNSSTFN